MPFQTMWGELGTSNEAHLFLRPTLEVGISNVGSPQFEIVVFSEERNQAYPLQGDDSRVYRIRRYLGAMSSRHESYLCATTVLLVVHKVARNLGVSVRYGSVVSKVLEGIVVEELLELQFFSICPPSFSESFVNLHCFVMISWDLVAVLVDGLVTGVSELSLVDHPC